MSMDKQLTTDEYAIINYGDMTPEYRAFFEGIEYASQQTEVIQAEIERLKEEVKRLRMICILGDVPQHAIDGLSFPKPDANDIAWGKEAIERLKKHGVI